MTFHALGLNHATAPVRVREAFALDAEARRRIYDSVRVGAEAVIVSTCNRTEAYLYGTDADAEALRAAIAAEAGQRWAAEYAFSLADEAAVRHLLRVAAGLESLVLGEAQIIGQIKDAYGEASDADRVGSVLHRLMHVALRTAKRVRTETGLGDGSASISGLAVRVAQQHLAAVDGGTLAGRRVLLVGAGRMGVLALQALAGQGLARLDITNRTLGRAAQVAARFGGQVVPWADRHAAAASADVVLVAAGAAEPVLTAAALEPRSGRPGLILDIAIPRNVEPAVADLPGYTLFDLDALDARRQATAGARRAAVPAAERLCEEALGDYVQWVFNHQALQPTIQSLRDTFETIRIEEVRRHAHRFQSADAEQLEILTRSIMQKVLAVPIVSLKQADATGLDFARGVRSLAAIFARPEPSDDLSASCPYGFGAEGHPPASPSDSAESADPPVPRPEPDQARGAA